MPALAAIVTDLSANPVCRLLLLPAQSHRQDGSFYVFDDFREAYAWLRHNTHPETKVASW